MVGENAITWTDTNILGGASYSYRVHASNSNGFSAYSNIASLVTPEIPNYAPVLDFIGERSVTELSTLAFTSSAIDFNSPPQTLTFSLGESAPAGATIDPGSGQFSWTPAQDQGPEVYAVTVNVSDNGIPSMSDSETFNITVNQFIFKTLMPQIQR
jgi:hypothetical protein